MDATADSGSQLDAAARRLIASEDGRPAWIFSSDGRKLLWSNADGLALLSAETLDEALRAGVAPTAPATRSLQAVARTPLAAAGRGRIEILRVSAGGHQETLVATCKPVELDGEIVVLALGSLRNTRQVSPRTPVVSPFAQLDQTGAVEASVEPKAVEALEVQAEVVASETAAAAEPAQSTGGADAFAFLPRSRPHRFSFLVEVDGSVAGLSSGFADAVGPETALRAGENASAALSGRAVEAPAQVVQALANRERFSERTVLWPVSGTPVAVPVRMTGFGEDDGRLRVFGTVLTAQAEDLPDETGPAELPEPSTLDEPVAAVDEPLAPIVDAETDDAFEEAAPELASSDDTLDEIAEGLNVDAGEDAVVETASPTGFADKTLDPAALATAASALAAGVAAGLSKPLDTVLPAIDDEADVWQDEPLVETPAKALADVGSSDGLDDDLELPALDEALDDDLGANEAELELEPQIAAVDEDDSLTKPERLTFQEIARRLGARITGRDDEPDTSDDSEEAPAANSPVAVGEDEADRAFALLDDDATILDTSGDEIEVASSDDEDPSQGDFDRGDLDGGDLEDGIDAPALAPFPGPGSNRNAPHLTLVGGDDDDVRPGGEVVPFARAAEGSAERQLLDKLPLSLIIYADDKLLYANRTALDLIGLQSLDALRAYSRVENLFEGGMAGRDGSMTLIRLDGSRVRVRGRLQAVRWDGQPAALLSIQDIRGDRTSPASMPTATALNPAADAPASLPEPSAPAMGLVSARIAELEAIIDLASDGVVTLDRTGEIKSLNQAAQALVGYSADDLVGRPFRLLFAEDSRQVALEYLDDMAGQDKLSLFNQGREVECLTAQGGLVPVFMTLGLLTDEQPALYCAVLRDLSPFKQAETDLVEARRAAEQANAHKSDFLARVSHEIRTPLNAVIGFSEVMLEERFGPVGSERYRQYLRDIHTSGEHLMSLLNDLLDLSKIEAGRMEMKFAEVDLNDVVQQCLAIMQPQASQGRIIVRTSLPLTVPKVVSDIRSVRQIVLNLMSNAIKFTDAGGQIIVSTLYEPTGEVSLRVRDTGRGMTSADLELALEPFRQVPTTINQVISGTGLGLPLTKALVEANKAQFAIESTPGEGTLAKVTFPPQRVLAE
ncbi:MAG: PAS domain S-box protein [Devosiaceae bacterium]|nr:PAS domain S-box protein [Devosiaceae bacterium MH13]